MKKGAIIIAPFFIKSIYNKMKNMISKEKFLSVCDKHKPTKIIEWYFNNFSKESRTRRGKNILFLILGTMFLIGLVSTIFKWNNTLILYITYAYSLILSIFVGMGFAIAHLNNKRIRRIIDELGITNKEYEKYLTNYGKKI